MSNLCFEEGATRSQEDKEVVRQKINLGYSSRHALNVSLVLNLQTGLVSPQYHCQYDDLFETIQEHRQDQYQHHNGSIKQD